MLRILARVTGGFAAETVCRFQAVRLVAGERPSLNRHRQGSELPNGQARVPLWLRRSAERDYERHGRLRDAAPENWRAPGESGAPLWPHRSSRWGSILPASIERGRVRAEDAWWGTEEADGQV